MFRVIHLIPFDGVGGVEVAAKSIGSCLIGETNIEIQYIFKNVEIKNNYFSTFNPIKMFNVAWLIARSDVDLLVVSLWRSSIVGLIAKLCRPKLRLITFLHLDKNVHFLDFIFTYLSAKASIEVWADSNATLNNRFSRHLDKKSRVISFVTERFQPLLARKVEASFIFWGRISQQKNLVRSLRIFSAIKQSCPEAKFTIIGPDLGALKSLNNVCVSLGLADSVFFIGSVQHNQIAHYAQNASFYLQTSVSEGMAMSVVEAMQFGLVPVVTAVGEINAYCKDGFNSVLVNSNKNSVEKVISLIDDNNSYQIIRRNATKTWLQKPIYRESFLMACNDVLISSDSH